MLKNVTIDKISIICNLADEMMRSESQKTTVITIPSKMADKLINQIIYGEKNALTATIESLNRAEIAELLALMWIGRGDFGRDPTQFTKIFADAHNRELSLSLTYILEELRLGTYLRKGLQHLKPYM